MYLCILAKCEHLGSSAQCAVRKRKPIAAQSTVVKKKKQAVAKAESETNNGKFGENKPRVVKLYFFALADTCVEEIQIAYSGVHCRLWYVFSAH